MHAAMGLPGREPRPRGPGIFARAVPIAQEPIEPDADGTLSAEPATRYRSPDFAPRSRDRPFLPTEVISMNGLSPRSRFRPLVLAALSALVAAAAGCGGKSVTRIDEDETVDISGRWNDTDSRLVSEEMIKDCLNQQWIRTHMTERSTRPVVIVGAIRNKSMEHIPTDTFIADIERAFVNSGDVTVVADAGERADLRAEREAMQ
jgi:hypothetical protein